jgi:hypothetical protein
MTGRRASGFTVVVKTLRERQSSAPPAACGHIFPKAVALMLPRLEVFRRGKNGAKRLAAGYATGEANLLLPVGACAYGMPRNLKRLELILRPVMGPARSVTTVCVLPEEGGKSTAGAAAGAAATLAVELVAAGEATCGRGLGLASESNTLINVKTRRKNDCISERIEIDIDKRMSRRT